MQQTNNILDESNKLLAQIKNAAKVKEIKRAKRKYYFQLLKKWGIRIVLVLFVCACIFYPIESGTIIGTWIRDFFGTVYKNIIN